MAKQSQAAVIEHNVATDEITIRPFTEQESTQLANDRQEQEQAQAAAAEIQQLKAALLEKLGITADEAQLLFS